MANLDQSIPGEFPEGGGGSSSGGSGSGVGGLAQSAKEQAPQVAQQAAGQAREVVSEVRGQARVVAGEARDQIQGLVRQTGEELRSQAENKSQQAASGLRSLSSQLSALRNGRPEQAGSLGRYLGDAESRVASLAERLERGGVSGVMDDVTRFARRRPGLFLVGAVGAGFLVGRLVRSGAAAGDGEGGGERSWGGSLDGPRMEELPAPVVEVTPASPVVPVGGGAGGLG